MNMMQKSKFSEGMPSAKKIKRHHKKAGITGLIRYYGL